MPHDTAAIRSPREDGSSHRCITPPRHRLRPGPEIQGQVGPHTVRKCIIITYAVKIQHSRTGMPGDHSCNTEVPLLPGRGPTVRSMDRPPPTGRRFRQAPTHSDESATNEDERKSNILQFHGDHHIACLLYTSPSPRDRQKSRMPSSA